MCRQTLLLFQRPRTTVQAPDHLTSHNLALLHLLMPLLLTLNTTFSHLFSDQELPCGLRTGGWRHLAQSDCAPRLSARFFQGHPAEAAPEGAHNTVVFSRDTLHKKCKSNCLLPSNLIIILLSIPGYSPQGSPQSSAEVVHCISVKAYMECASDPLPFCCLLRAGVQAPGGDREQLQLHGVEAL